MEIVVMTVTVTVTVTMAMPAVVVFYTKLHQNLVHGAELSYQTYHGETTH